MSTAVKLLLWLFGFGAALGTVYWFLTFEPAGTFLLWSFAIMPLVVAAYLLSHGALRRPRPDDDPDAVPDQAAGEAVGTFPAASAWPVPLVIGAIVAGASLVYGLLLLPPGIALMALSIIGLMRESRD